MTLWASTQYIPGDRYRGPRLFVRAGNRSGTYGYDPGAFNAHRDALVYFLRVDPDKIEYRGNRYGRQNWQVS